MKVNLSAEPSNLSFDATKFMFYFEGTNYNHKLLLCVSFCVAGEFLWM